MKSVNRRRRLRVAAVQMNSFGSPEENLARMERALAQAGRAAADVVLFPECVTTGYGGDFGGLRPAEMRRCLEAVGSMAKGSRLHVLVGSPVFAGRRWYNGLVAFDRSGQLVHVYAKCQLTERDRRFFTPGDSLSLFTIDGVEATAIICHERRYPELVRLPVMAGAQVVFHPNAGMDALAVSRAKRGGRDGIAVRAFENAVFYVFANTVGAQGGGKWSAGDSKIVAPDGTVLGVADHKNETVLVADLDLGQATRKYALDSLEHPRFLARHWRRLVGEMRRGVAHTNDRFLAWYEDRSRPGARRSVQAR